MDFPRVCCQVTEANLPSEASIELPQVHVSAEYIQDGSNALEGQFGGNSIPKIVHFQQMTDSVALYEK